LLRTVKRMPPASASSWGTKLECKLSTLTATSSKETLQTLAKWIAFNRKRAAEFVPVLLKSLQQPVLSLQPVLLGVVHEVLLVDRSTPKWDRLEALRLALGEGVLLPAAPQLEQVLHGKFQEMLDEWDAANVFGEPTLLNQLRKALSPPLHVQSVEVEAQPISESPAHDAKAPPVTETSGYSSPAPGPPSSKLAPPSEASPPVSLGKRPLSAVDDTGVSYDFESRGIPEAHVERKAFQEPCRVIATLQIARDLRNDGAVQLSSLLSAMPEDIRAACAKAAEHDNHLELDEATAQDYSIRINQSLLDMDLEDQALNALTFRSIVDLQRQARQQLIELLVQSRCKFGADEAAEAFHQADRAKAELLRRRHILIDAMELEGLDVAENPRKEDGPEEELAPLTWYTAQ
jgi:hypothetical protein